MPAFDKFAYSDGRCYGKKKADLKAYPTRMPDPPATLQPREIDLLADFLMAKIVGKGPMNQPSASSSGASETDACKEFPRNDFGGQSIQRKHEQIAGILQVVEFHGMQVPSAGLNRNVLFWSDRVGHRRALQRGARR